MGGVQATTSEHDESAGAEAGQSEHALSLFGGAASAPPQEEVSLVEEEDWGNSDAESELCEDDLDIFDDVGGRVEAPEGGRKEDGHGPFFPYHCGVKVEEFQGALEETSFWKKVVPIFKRHLQELSGRAVS